jgi:putative endopeptidase
MINRIGFSLAVAIMMLCVLCAESLAQAPATEVSGTKKIYELLPGLDKRLIDPTADPCVDFFKYACGNFSKLYPIPSDRPAFGTGAMIAEYTQNVLHSMLEKAATAGSSRTPNEQKIGDNYAACMDVGAISRSGLKPLRTELDRIAAIKSAGELPEIVGTIN